MKLLPFGSVASAGVAATLTYGLGMAVHTLLYRGSLELDVSEIRKQIEAMPANSADLMRRIGIEGK